MLGSALAAGEGVGAQTAPAPAETAITWKGAPEFRSGGWTFKPRGRVFLDFVHQEVEGGASVAEDTANDARVRTARLGVQGSWNDRFRYVAEASIANGDLQWEDLLLEIAPSDHTTLSVGNFKTVSLENTTSARYTTFMERGPFNDVLGVGRTLNLAGSVNGDAWMATAALSGDDVNDLDVAGNETVAVSGRMTFAPLVTETARVHLGGWIRHRDRGDGDALRYRARPNTNYGERYIDTGAIGASDTTVAAEAAVVVRNVSVQGEYARVSAERAAGAEVDLDAFYVFASWFPTGEMRNYQPDAGEFGRTPVLRPVTAGGPGAIELALRYDRVDLGGARVGVAPARAGEYEGVTLGANWYPFPYVRFMANYTVGENDNPVDAFDADADTFQVRAQFDF